jgi:hypothetical protein
MSVEVDRRVFVGSVAAGLPLLVGGATQLAFAQRPGRSALARDPVASQLATEMKRAVRGLSKAPSGEHVRQLASALRVLSKWGVSKQIDARVKETLRGVIAREGRGALFARDVDPAMFKEEAREFGFDGTSIVPLRVPPSVDYTARKRIVDDLLANGVTAHWKTLADTLESAATSLDRMAVMRSRGMTLVAQTDPSICEMIQQELYYLNLQMVFWCGPWFAWAPEPCGLVMSAYLGVAAVEWWYSC